MSDPNLTVTRRRALHALFERFWRQDLSGLAPGIAETSAGVPDAAGQSTRFAKAIGVHITALSHMRSSRPISDKMARQFEARLRSEMGWDDVQSGWMDQEREVAVVMSAEKHVMEQALAAYRRGNARSRRTLLKMLEGFER